MPLTRSAALCILLVLSNNNALTTYSYKVCVGCIGHDDKQAGDRCDYSLHNIPFVSRKLERRLRWMIICYYCLFRVDCTRRWFTSLCFPKKSDNLEAFHQGHPFCSLLVCHGRKFDFVLIIGDGAATPPYHVAFSHGIRPHGIRI